MLACCSNATLVQPSGPLFDEALVDIMQQQNPPVLQLWRLMDGTWACLDTDNNVWRPYFQMAIIRYLNAYDARCAWFDDGMTLFAKRQLGDDPAQLIKLTGDNNHDLLDCSGNRHKCRAHKTMGHRVIAGDPDVLASTRMIG